MFIAFLKLFLLAFGSMAIMMLLIVMTIDGSFMIEGVAVPRSEFMRLIVPAAIAGPMSLVLAYAFWKEQPWVRPLAVAMVLTMDIVIVATLLPSQPWPIWIGVIGFGLTYLVAAIWYFYLKETTAEYYRSMTK